MALVKLWTFWTAASLGFAAAPAGDPAPRSERSLVFGSQNGTGAAGGLAPLVQETSPARMDHEAKGRAKDQTVPEMVVLDEVRPFPPTAAAAYLWWLLILYMFYVMAVVCDEYLVPTVDIMCERLSIPEDVAGATLMAFACNGPELLTNTCAIFITHSKVGMGTIVGSAIFNVLVIVGACPIVTQSGVLDIPTSTFLRDCIFSAISIVVLAWALPVIDFLRASVLLGMAGVYVLVVAKFRTWFGEPAKEELEQLEEKIASREAEARAQSKEPVFKPRKILRSATMQVSPVSPKDETFRRIVSDGETATPFQRLGSKRVSAVEAYNQGPEDREEFWAPFKDGSFVAVPPLEGAPSLTSRLWGWAHFLMVAPTTIILHWTIPDIKVESKKRLYVLAFILSMAWLSATAWVVCLGSDQINLYWGIPQSFLGLTLAAVGTSFPNLFASMITARAGRGPIAVSNALGSNVQNVFLVLALPIWVRVLQKGEYVMHGNDIDVSIIWMAATLAVVLIAVAAQRFQLTSQAGWCFMLVYAVFVIHMTASSSG